MPKTDAEIVCVSLISFDQGPVWWIGLKHFAPEFVGFTLEDCEDQEEFGDMFEASTCLETHPPYPAQAAIDRARQIAKELGLPLYRRTQFQRDGDDCSVYELAD